MFVPPTKIYGVEGITPENQDVTFQGRNFYPFLENDF
jgi:hypothetical protein